MTILVFSAEIIIYFISIYPYYEYNNVAVAVTVLFLVSLVSLIVSLIICGTTDPADKIMKEYKKAISKEGYVNIDKDLRKINKNKDSR